jgi:hypothetical protein
MKTQSSPDQNRKKRILIVDVVGFDRRRMTPEVSPFLCGLFERHTAQRMPGQPTTEVWPALVCGVNPGVEGHLLWHARLRDEPIDPWWAKPLKVMPDYLVSALQLVPHFFMGHDFDVPAIPHWRRRQMEFHRLKYHVRSLRPEKYNVVGGAKSMFEPLGKEALHEVVSKFEDLDEVVSRYPTDHRMQFLEFHCFDLVSHWYLDRMEVMNPIIRKVDDAVAALSKKCEEQGVLLCVLFEHGQELVTKERHLNMRKVVHSAGVSRKDFCYYNGVAVSRFWFRTPEAREKIVKALKTIEHTRTVTYQELNEELDMTLTPEWGEVYIACDAGYLFHPHDYYHPLGNIFVGLKSKEMRQRMFDPYHRGYHGYFPGPNAPSEDAWAIFDSDTVKPTTTEARLIDFAPSVLSLIDEPIPDYMRGKPTFKYVEASPVKAGEPVLEARS